MAAQSQQVPSLGGSREDNANLIWVGPQQAAGLVRLAGEVPLRVLIGPQSSGKSTLLGHLKRVISNAVVLSVAGPQDTASSVLTALLSETSLGSAGEHTEIGQRNTLVTLFQKLTFAGKRVVLCIDNVARFSASAWKEVDRLRLLQGADRPLVELVIAANDDETSKAPLRSLLHEGATSAIEASFCLSPPTDEEVSSYLAWRLARQKIVTRFAPDACAAINRLGLGRYGAINTFCQYLLLSVPGASVIDADMVQRSAPSLAALRRRASTTPRKEPKSVGGNDVKRVSAKTGDCLVVAFQDTVIREIRLGGRIMIGSAEDSDLHLVGRFVSRHHALIVPVQGGTYYVADLNSEHGLAVNGKAVNCRVLCDGDVIGVGPFRLKVQLAATDAPQHAVGGQMGRGRGEARQTA